MSKCHHPDKSTCCSSSNHEGVSVDKYISWWQSMVPHALEYATQEKKKGKKVVGIMCEYTPREIIMAAQAVPVCLCGGSVEMIPPAEQFLPANLCPLIKSTFGYSVQNANPFLEMLDLIIGETTCDGKKKMFEILSERHPLVVLELPQKPDDGDALQHWKQELQKLKVELEKRFHLEITNEALLDAVRLMNRERSLKRKLAELMKVKNPPLTGRELLDMKSLISCIPADLEQYEKAIAELPGRVLYPAAESRIRVLMTGVPMPHGAEKVLDIVEANGGLVVCQENCTGLKPVIEDIVENKENPIAAIAEKYFHLPCSVMTKNEKRLESLCNLAKEYKPDCVIELIWQACITYDVESALVKKLVEEEMGIPYLRIETDYSPSDSARISMRIQALFETIKERMDSATEDSMKSID